MFNWLTRFFGGSSKSQRKKVQVDIPFEQLHNEPRPKRLETPAASDKRDITEP